MQRLAVVVAMLVAFATPVARAAPRLARVVDGRVNDWRGLSSGLAGTTQVSRGELIYQDHLFDDLGAETRQRSQQHGTTGAPAGDFRYPTDPTDPAKPPRYASNAADIQALRVASDDGDVWLLARMSALLVPDSTVVAFGFDVDDDAVATRPWPHDAGVAAAGVDVVVTLWGTGGDAVDLRSATPTAVAIAVAADTSNAHNAIEARVPRELLATRMTMFAAAGLWDAAVGTWMPVPNGSPTADTPGGGSPLVTSRVWNAAFRETAQTPDVLETGSFYEENQAAALASGDLSGFRSPDVDLDELARGITGEPVALEGGRFYDVIIDEGHAVAPGADAYADNEGVSYAGVPGRFTGVGGAALTQQFEFLGRFQPYSLYVPRSFDRAVAMPAALVLHGIGGSHSTYNTQPGFVRDMGEGPEGTGTDPMFLITPLARGASFYADWGEADTLAVLRDAFRRVTIDRERLYLTGYSMGGYGVYRLASLYPARFAAAAVWAGYNGEFLGSTSAAGLPSAGQEGRGGGRAIIGDPVDTLDNLRYLPLVHAVGTNDEIVPTIGQLAAPRKLERLGYRSRLDVYPGYEHFSFALVDDWKQARAYLGTRTRQATPSHVTYKFSDGWTAPGLAARLRLVHGNAWWLRDLTMRWPDPASPPDGLTVATADASTSEIAGDPAPAPTSYAVAPTPTPNLQQEVTWPTTPTTAPGGNVLNLNLASVSSATVDLFSARLPGCGLNLVVNSDGPVTLRLHQRFKPAASFVGSGEIRIRRIEGGSDVLLDLTGPASGTIVCP